MQHCAGVNALALSADEQQLWTGSRDSIVAWWVAGLWGDQEPCNLRSVGCWMDALSVFC